MPMPCIVPADPRRQSAFQPQGTYPLTEPAEFFFEGPHEPFRMGVPLARVAASAAARVSC